MENLPVGGQEDGELGYDIEIGLPDGRLRLIRGKGWTGGASTITITRSEILHSLNMPEASILSFVEFFENGDH
ncbi:MAG: DUF3883 domain-containing protein [Ectothiorhodospiraceae bacterium AqS1]|nr:DUF3883 domain-containing protein [Ectothiorhodospiraceae bacterium AqS1]